MQDWVFITVPLAAAPPCCSKWRSRAFVSINVLCMSGKSWHGQTSITFEEYARWLRVFICCLGCLEFQFMLARSRESRKKRRRLAMMSLCVFAAGTLIAVVAVFAIGFSTARPPVAENGASHADPNSVGTIVLHSSTSACQRKSFNNQTGQISDQMTPCSNDVVLDAKGLPTPAGTIHTLNSISKSFQ
jgi:hypothetical protein